MPGVFLQYDRWSRRGTAITTWYRQMIAPNGASTIQANWSKPARLRDAPAWVRDFTCAMEAPILLPNSSSQPCTRRHASALLLTRPQARTRWLSYLAMVHAQPSPDWRDLGLFWEHEPTPLQCAQKRLAFAMTMRACATHPLVTDVDVVEIVGNIVVTRTDPRPRCRDIMRKLGPERGCKWLEAEWVIGTFPLTARVVDIANGFALAVQRKLVCSAPLVIYSLGSRRLSGRSDYQDTTFIHILNREGCSETKPRFQKRKEILQSDEATLGTAGGEQHGKGGVVDSRLCGTNAITNIIQLNFRSALFQTDSCKVVC